MTEYWVAAAKFYCEICKCWTSGHINNINRHKNGAWHQENERKMLIDSKKREKEKKDDEDTLKNQLADIERAAMAAMMKDGFGASPATAGPVHGPMQGPSLPSQEVAEQKAQIEATVQQHAAKRQKTTQGSHGGSALEQAGTRRELALLGMGNSTSSDATASSSSQSPATTQSAWTVARDPGSGLLYYHNASTGVSTWEKPADFSMPSEPSTIGPDLGPAAAAASVERKSAWTVVTDPTSGRVYFFNTETGISTWEKPPDFEVDLARPPGPPPGRPGKASAEAQPEMTEEADGALAVLKAKRKAEKQRKVEEAAKAKRPDGVGQWTEVTADESAWRGEAPQPDSDEEPLRIDPLLEAKYGMEKGGELVKEDLEAVEKTMCEKKSLQVNSSKATGFGTRKKAAGIRKSRTADDD